jgi:hypothetical protein
MLASARFPRIIHDYWLVLSNHAARTRSWWRRNLLRRPTVDLVATVGLVINGAHQTLHSFLKDWLQNAAKPRLRPRTYAGYEHHVTENIDPLLGRILGEGQGTGAAMNLSIQAMGWGRTTIVIGSLVLVGLSYAFGYGIGRLRPTFP